MSYCKSKWPEFSSFLDRWFNCHTASPSGPNSAPCMTKGLIVRLRVKVARVQPLATPVVYLLNCESKWPEFNPFLDQWSNCWTVSPSDPSSALCWTSGLIFGLRVQVARVQPLLDQLSNCRTASPSGPSSAPCWTSGRIGGLRVHIA